MRHEGNFQDDLLKANRQMGILCTKFTDRFIAGIPDTLLEVPTVPPAGFPPGMRIELKAVPRAEMPKRASTKWPEDAHPSTEQASYMRARAHSPYPPLLVLKCPWGWVALPPAVWERFYAAPHTEFRSLFTKQKPLYHRIWENSLSCSSNLSST